MYLTVCLSCVLLSLHSSLQSQLRTASASGPALALSLVNARASNGYTPLLEAAARGSVDAVKFFVQNGADTSVCDRRGESVLHVAASRDHRGVIEYLLSDATELGGKSVCIAVSAFVTVSLTCLFAD